MSETQANLPASSSTMSVIRASVIKKTSSLVSINQKEPPAQFSREFLIQEVDLLKQEGDKLEMTGAMINRQANMLCHYINDNPGMIYNV